MRKTLYAFFKVFIFLVLLTLMLGWVLHFNKATDRLLDIRMFSLIGIAFLVMGFFRNNRLVTGLMWMCGLFLIAINFFPGSTTLNFIGVICLLVPMLIERFSTEEGNMV